VKALALALVCAGTLLAGPVEVRASQDHTSGTSSDKATFPDLPLPPAVEGAPEVLPMFSARRAAYVALVRREAHAQGMPPDLADAVAFVESSYNPKAVGSVGEIGLMQIRPQTAAMLGYKGDEETLFQPEIHVRYSVTYLAGAWRKADGDVCRTLMKYRAGHGEERMTPLSVEYCRRAKSYLASIGSPLAEGALPSPIRVADLGGADAPMATQGRPARVQAREQVDLRKLKGAQYWAAHERRVAAIVANLKRRGIVQ
jgi:hypothetical protein